MIITTTSIAFILLSLGLVSCGVWLLRSFQKDGGVREYGWVGFLLSGLFLAFSFNNGIIGVGTLLFAKNSEALYFILITAHFFLTLIAILGVYTVCYIFSSRLSSYIGMAFVGILGTVGVIMTIITHPRPYISLQNSIEWNMNFLPSLLFFGILFISIGSTLYIFTRVFLAAQTRQVKFFSLLISTLAFAAILIHFIRFILLYTDTYVRNSIEDFGTLLMCIVFINNVPKSSKRLRK